MRFVVVPRLVLDYRLLGLFNTFGLRCSIAAAVMPHALPARFTHSRPAHCAVFISR